MKPVIIGGVVAAALVLAFVGGSIFQEEQDSPLENAAESLNDAAEELGD